jgi:hypothetical protein
MLKNYKALVQITRRIAELHKSAPDYISSFFLLTPPLQIGRPMRAWIKTSAYHWRRVLIPTRGHF